ncbi:MAG: iron ABC transporter permease, partial [Kiloniellales bacterium]|nr:iron ABC transporter permease [Kiloniellales bacterium]
MTAAADSDSRQTPGCLLLPFLALATGLAFAASLLVGPATIGLRETATALLAGNVDATALIVREVRLPRAVLGLLIGAALGLAGAALQGFLRNPLAEPGLIGVSGSAAFGAVLTFYTGLAGLFSLALPLGGMAGACLGVFVAQALAGRDGSPLTLILAGVAVTSFAAALTSLALNLAPNPFAALEIVFWLMGSLADRSFDHVWLAAPFMIAGTALLLTLGRPLDALTLGEDTAKSLGFDLRGVRRRLVFGTALSIGAATSVAGAIGFVGL